MAFSSIGLPWHCKEINCVLEMEFESKQEMQRLLEPPARLYEGGAVRRVGFNFPLYLPSLRSHLGPELSGVVDKHPRCTYLIGYLRGDIPTLLHERCHALFHQEACYRALVARLWEWVDAREQARCSAFMHAQGYPPAVHLDEFQAYLLTERRSLWGGRLTQHSLPRWFLKDAAPYLLRIFPAGQARASGGRG
jgi:hypothetical protein